MPRDHRLYLDDILGAIDRIQSYIVQTKLDPLRAACRNALADGLGDRGATPPTDSPA